MFYIYCTKCEYKTDSYEDEEDAVYEVCSDGGDYLDHRNNFCPNCENSSLKIKED